MTQRTDTRASGSKVQGTGARAATTPAAVLASLAAVTGWVSARPASAVPLEVYGRLPQIEDVALSPDGSQIAFVTTAGDARIVVVGPVADPKAIFRLRIAEQKLRGIEWADNTHVLMEMSTTDRSTVLVQGGYMAFGGEAYQLQVLDTPTHKTMIVPKTDELDKGGGSHWLNVIFADPMVRSVNGHTVLFLRGQYNTFTYVPVLFRLDLNTGVQSVFREGGASTAGWLVGPDGELAAEENFFERPQPHWNVLARLKGNATMTEVASGEEGIDIPSLVGFGPEPDTLIIRQVEDGDYAWKPISLRDGKLGSPMGPIEFVIEDGRANQLVGYASDDRSRHFFFDSDLQKRWDTILAAFVGERVRLASLSDDRTKIVVLVEGARHGFAYFLIDLATGRAKALGPVYEGVTRPLEVRRISYTAQDGFVVPAYLTLPPARDPKKLPLVVLPHGGPALRDTGEFDWWSQALADQGYAVLRPNYRGSDLGRAHLEAGFGQFGRKMQTDLSDGVRYLAKEGIIDPARVCIVGGSYGGYAALAGVTLDPGVYRCAVSVAGISDLKRYLHREGFFQAQRYWDRYMGVTGASDPALDAISPIVHVDAITVPVLLIHGRDDSVVPFEQSQVMLDAMKRAKKDVQLVTLNREDHWLSRSETRLQMLQTSVQFLRAHNPPD